MFVHIRHASTHSGTLGTIDSTSVELIWEKLLFTWDYWSGSAHIYWRIHAMCILTDEQRHARTLKSVRHSRSHMIACIHTPSYTRTRFSNQRSRLLPSPATAAMSVCFLSSPSGCVDSLLLWQAHWKWQHDLYSSTNMPGNISPHGMAGKRLGMPVTVFYTFGLNWRAARSWWAATSSVSRSAALCLVLTMSVILCIRAREWERLLVTEWVCIVLMSRAIVVESCLLTLKNSLLQEDLPQKFTAVVSILSEPPQVSHISSNGL